MLLPVTDDGQYIKSFSVLHRFRDINTLSM